MNDELLVSYLLDEATPAERVRVDAWIRSHSTHLRYFEHFKSILDASSALVVPATVREDEAWQRFRQRIKEPAKIRRLNMPVQRLRIAAAILILSTMAVFYLMRTASTRAMIYAAADTVKAETLPDGSVATLNKHSQIRYERKNHARKVQLKGEAFFNVVADKEKPFVVDVNDIHITVLGTSFNVKSMKGNTEVVVETGSVRIDKGTKTLILRQGERAAIEAKDTTILKEPSGDELYNYYRTHEFVCDATPLWKLVEVLNEAYNVHIVIENKELRNQPLTTTFSNQSLDTILNVIGQTFSITVDRRANEIILK